MRRLWLAIAMLAWAAAAWINAEQWAPLGATRALAALGAMAGVLAAARLESLRLRLVPFWGLVALAGASLAFGSWLVHRLEFPSAWLNPERLLMAVGACGWGVGWGLAAFSVRVTARRAPLFVGLEALIICAGFVSILAGHRQGYIDRPFFLVDPLWSGGYDPVPFFLAIGAVVALLGTVVCASHSPRRSLLDLAVIALLVVAGFLLLPVQKLKDLPQLQRGSEGAQKTPARPKGGGTPTPGKSPDKDKGEDPSFGDVSPPSGNPALAVVLFSDDYDPTGGAFYFRQSASSQFNGVRLIKASDYDLDVAERFPTDGEPVRPRLPELQEDAFQPLDTRVALMTQHTTPFGLFQAERFESQPNPDPNRFQKAYSVRSRALTLPYKAMVGYEAGDSHWDRATWAHYTAGPKDPRYAELARKILGAMPAEQSANKFLQAVYIKLWMDENCIYSLTCKSADSTDPVGDYLFGDRTGYCVYLSHAACYLWRSAGIPARIASGYMVPAADKGKGSALLVRARSSHSWPEIYLEGLGWIPLDISPHKSLVPAPAPADSSLQQMMGDMARNQPAPDKPKPNRDLQQQLWAALLALLGYLPGLLLALVVWTYAMRLGRRLAPRYAPESRLPVVALISLLDQLAERGELRRPGQSREDFARQLHDRCLSLSMLTRANLAAKLGGMAPQNRSHYLELLAHARRELAGWPLPWWRRVLIFLDPISWWKTK